MGGVHGRRPSTWTPPFAHGWPAWVLEPLLVLYLFIYSIVLSPAGIYKPQRFEPGEAHRR